MPIEDVRAATAKDEELMALIELIKVASSGDSLPSHLSAYKHCFEELNACDGVLLRGQRLVIPRGLRQRVVQLAHVGHKR